MAFIELSTLELSLAAIIIAIAFLVRGIAGFGSGLIAIPLLALMFPVSVVVPMIGVLDFLTSASHGVRERRAIAWRDLAPFAPALLLGVGAALYLFHTLDQNVLRNLLGGFILCYGIYSLAGLRVLRGGSRAWALPIGGLGGLIGTLFGTGGPFYVIYLQIRDLEKTAFRATIASIFLLDGGARIVGYLATGLFTRDVVYMTGAALPLVALVMYLGGRIHTNISAATFSKVISVLLVCSGIALLAR